MAKSSAEELFALQLRQVGLKPEREVKFHPTRKWRFDFSFPKNLIAVEIEGGAFSGGRHTRGAGFRGDCEKYNEAAVLGWRVIRVLPEHVKSGEALEWLLEAMEI